MSRGFVKESDREEPPFIPSRPPLPEGTPNYVTKLGLKLLQAEMKELEKEKKSVLQMEHEQERRKALVVVNRKIAQVEERIQSARLIVAEEQEKDKVRFGAKVQLEVISGKDQGKVYQFSIVGVDEANVKEGKLPFTAPFVKNLIGMMVGELKTFKMGDLEQNLKLQTIDYELE